MNYSTGHRTGHMKTLRSGTGMPVAGSSREWRQEGRAPDGPLQEDRPADRNRHATSPGRPAERRRHPNLLATIDVVRDTPGLARFRFIARNRWIAGTHSQTTIHGFMRRLADEMSRELKVMAGGSGRASWLVHDAIVQVPTRGPDVRSGAARSSNDSGSRLFEGGRSCPQKRLERRFQVGGQRRRRRIAQDTRCVAVGHDEGGASRASGDVCVERARARPPAALLPGSP